MKKGIVIIIIIVLATAGYGLYKRLSAARKLKVGVADFKLTQKLLNLKSLDSLTANLSLKIDNFSSEQFNIEQSSIEVYAITGEQIAAQTEPLSTDTTLFPDKSNTLTIPIELSAQKALMLINANGGLLQVAQNKALTGDYGIEFIIKGFVKANGLTVDINERVKI